MRPSGPRPAKARMAPPWSGSGILPEIPARPGPAPYGPRPADAEGARTRGMEARWRCQGAPKGQGSEKPGKILIFFGQITLPPKPAAALRYKRPAEAACGEPPPLGAPRLEQPLVLERESSLGYNLASSQPAGELGRPPRAAALGCDCALCGGTS